MLEVMTLLPDQWSLFKSLRLKALADFPQAFGTTLAQAQAWDDAEWQMSALRFTPSSPAVCCIAFFGNSPCGMANCFLSPDSAETADVTAFWVTPESRGQGVADALVTYAADWAIARGITVLQAWVVEDNLRAIGFYKKVGFCETEQRQLHKPVPLKQIVLLAKKLS